MNHHILTSGDNQMKISKVLLLCMSEKSAHMSLGAAQYV